MDREHHSLRRWMHQRRRPTKVQSRLIVGLLLSALVAWRLIIGKGGDNKGDECYHSDNNIFSPVLMAGEEDHFPQWNTDLMHNECRSQRTMHFPFRVGCPHECQSYRNEKGVSTGADDDDDEVPYYRVTAEWYFGEPNKFDPDRSWESQNGKSKYKQGINFEGPEAFVRTFQAAANELKKEGERQLSDKPGKEFKVHPQKRMHSALSYLCCLSAVEAEKSLPVIDEWIDETDFNFTLRFTEIQSWHERPNSVTNIVLVDKPSQRTMMRMNHDLNRKLTEAGIPIIVPREDQMPFHSTVAGFRYSSKGESYDPKYEIGSKLPDIYSLVRAVSEKYRYKWNVPDSQSFRILHKPRRSPSPSIHTYPLIDKA